MHCICLIGGENDDHHFLCIAVSKGLWTRLFKIDEEEWVTPRRIEDFLFTNFCGFGGNRDLEKLSMCLHNSMVYLVGKK